MQLSCYSNHTRPIKRDIKTKIDEIRFCSVETSEFNINKLQTLKQKTLDDNRNDNALLNINFLWPCVSFSQRFEFLHSCKRNVKLIRDLLKTFSLALFPSKFPPLAGSIICW